MTDHSQQLVQKLWNYCNILRDDGLSYGDYVEQLTFLFFLKMADEQSRPRFNKPSPIPMNVDWQSLMRLDGDELETQYRVAGQEGGMLASVQVILESDGEESKLFSRMARMENCSTIRAIQVNDSAREILNGKEC